MKHVILLSGNRPHAGKDTFVDEFLKVMALSESSHLKLSLPLKELCESAFAPLVEYLDIHTDAPSTNSENWYKNKNDITRLILQAMGGDVLNEINEDYLINKVIDTIKGSEDKSVFIVSDWRKSIEYQILDGLANVDITTVRINRPLVGEDTQNSEASIETELDRFDDMDFTIDNDGSLDQYHSDVSALCKNINGLISEVNISKLENTITKIVDEPIIKSPKIGTHYKTNKDIIGHYHMLRKGHKDILDYPTHYNEVTGELGICQGHGVYTWITKDDYTII